VGINFACEKLTKHVIIVLNGALAEQLLGGTLMLSILPIFDAPPSRGELRKFYLRCKQDDQRKKRNRKLLCVAVILLLVCAFGLGLLVGHGGF